MNENELRSCAAAARENLFGLIPDANERERADKSLGEALALPPGAAALALRKALRSHESTREFLRTRSAGAADETGPLGDDRAIGLPGVPMVRGTLFVCPKGDYSKVRESVAGGTPVCPNDGSVMARMDG